MSMVLSFLKELWSTNSLSAILYAVPGSQKMKWLNAFKSLDFLCSHDTLAGIVQKDLFLAWEISFSFIFIFFGKNIQKKHLNIYILHIFFYDVMSTFFYHDKKFVEHIVNFSSADASI